MITVLRQIWRDPVWSKVIAGVMLAALGAAIAKWWAGLRAAMTGAVKFLSAGTPTSNVTRWGILAGLAVLVGWPIGRLLYRAWWARNKAFLSFHAAAAQLYERTKAADVLIGSATLASPAARLGYHAAQLVHYAKFGKATFYGRKTPSTAMEPIPKGDLWTGKRADDMCSWITEDGVEYADLSIRRQDLRRVVRLVKRAVKGHNALLERARSRDNNG